VTASQRRRRGASCLFSCRGGHKIVFSAWSITGSFKRRWIDAVCRVITALMRWVRADIAAALSPKDSREMRPKYPKARPYLIAERSS
jgi:hypothetical protein